MQTEAQDAAAESTRHPAQPEPPEQERRPASGRRQATYAEDSKCKRFSVDESHAVADQSLQRPPERRQHERSDK
ncbi:hypothetical protein Vau01_064060 [Virgisporangium aurantiacum]|uniref:Uncharacterized protein n=1 Tax=Virgisporangium aurantiacum TaxID=175570 RepID=A0A8J3ZBX5_9ACTN|nr:hypothetical protein Vau01_064060 [Virgisporangium aurantiacum]